jgi:hypothetical protein
LVLFQDTLFLNNMYKITVETITAGTRINSYTKETEDVENKKTVYEQKLEELDVSKLAIFLNTKETSPQPTYPYPDVTGPANLFVPNRTFTNAI